MGTGKARRQFIYSTDLGKLLIWAIFNYEEREPIILSVDEHDEISINDVAQIILESMNLKKTQITSSKNKEEDGQIKKTVSNAKMQKYLPDFKFTPIEIGIKNTIEWFENFKNKEMF
jgi:GDP-L-fucose synthase